MPPPATSSGAPLTTRPLGRKKLEPVTRSISCRNAPTSRGGNASSSRNAVTNCAQTKNGKRQKLMPLVRSWIVVTMKLIAPSSDEVMIRIIDRIQPVWPALMFASGE